MPLSIVNLLIIINDISKNEKKLVTGVSELMLVLLKKITKKINKKLVKCSCCIKKTNVKR
jgi:hypothetical protein